ncbi:hypothetical protein EI427_25470 [Flammeovirga pectinis]|uniref:Uncharacterized protein n=1 Tax=Flammeovirga pectinis TaxID=2494373 RepID=A0A3Q9FT81_9BACT|nr:triple tyrosine motif-containing protein [Flammeovirga pectinis]AZQ65566.1 hypothetical protein EI427_25470 [Flammeovirga pectinis]
MKKLVFLFLYFFVNGLFSVATPIVPIVKSYNRFDYLGDRQNWDIDFDRNNNVYFANGSGLAQYSYGNWEFYTTTSKDKVISIKVDNDIIWSGGHSEYGYFWKEKNNQLSYTKCGNITDGQVWELEYTSNKVYMRTEQSITIYNSQTKKEEKIKSTTGFTRMKKWNKVIWAINRDNAFGYIKNNQFIITDTLANHSEVKELIIHNNELLLMHTDGSIYSFNGGIFQQLDVLPRVITKEGIFSIKNIDKSLIAVGTISAGLFIYDLNKRTIIEHIDATNGLNDDTILAINVDVKGNIWLGLDNGISYIEKQGALKTIFDKGATYKVITTAATTLLATNKGLYISEGKQPFTPVPKSQGQVWNMQQNKNGVFICHDNGLFLYKKKQLQPIYTKIGVMNICQFGKTDNYLMSTYIGVYLIQIRNNKVTIIDKLKNTNVTKMLYDENSNSVWTIDNNKNVRQYQFTINNTFSSKQHSNYNQIFYTDNQIVFVNDSSLLTYKDDKFRLLNTPPYSLLPAGNISALAITDNGSKYAYIKNGLLHMGINIHNGHFFAYDNAFNSLNNQFIKGYQFLEFYNGTLRITTETGVEIFDAYSESRTIETPVPVISKLSVASVDSTRNFFQPGAIKDPFPAGKTDIRLLFGIEKKSRDFNEYRYKLNGIDTNWSPWSVTNEKEYTQLDGGEYTFTLESRINNGAIKATTLSFKIHKYWYQTAWVLLPIFMLLILLYFIGRKIWYDVNQKAEKRQRKEQQIEIEHQTLAIRNEQLIKYAEEISRKNEFLKQVSDGLSLIKNKTAGAWVKRIENEMNNEKKNFIFYQLFSELHQDFIKKLNEDYPQLTSHDHRLISLIRFNLTNQEIANIMNITNRSVIMNRYRLRKKMELDGEIDLDKFIKDL